MNHGDHAQQTEPTLDPVTDPLTGALTDGDHDLAGHGRTPAAVLNEPANLVSPRAINYWRTGAIIGLVILLVTSTAVLALWPDCPWWAWLIAGALVALTLTRLIIMPTFRYRVHRWEVTDTAIYTRSGWVNVTTNIAPLSRVQTVDSHQTALMRPFGLASLQVSTASAAGDLIIVGLDQDVAREVVAHLVEVTGASEGDAT